MADQPEAGRAEPTGTFTALLEEVVRGAGTPRGDAPTGLVRGVVVGRYELVRELGRGGAGVVFEARDRELGRAVAFKVLRTSGEPARERRLLAEAEVAARLSHPNIVTVLDVGRDVHGAYLVQEYLAGQSLADRLTAGPLPLREALRIALEIARGLAHAHLNGVVHRDLSPRNVQLCDDGQVKLLDLGMAAALGRRKLEGGTPSAMAPEQARGAPEDERTDVWALGALLFRMLTGQPPVEVDRSGRPRAAPRGLAVPEAPGLATLVEAMLAEEPTARPRDAAAVLEALQETQASLPRTTAPGTGRVRVRPPGRVRWVTAGLIAGMTTAAAVGGAAWLLRGQPAGGGAVHPAEAVVLAGSSRLRPCAWEMIQGLPRYDLEALPPGARTRSGKIGDQGPSSVGGRSAWLQRSDWNQLIVPLPSPVPDPLVAEARFLVADADQREATVALHVLADPVGPMDWTSGLVRQGRVLQLHKAQGQAPVVNWSASGEGGRSRNLLRGTLPEQFAGSWHTLRVEASRSGGWLRASLDGVLLVAETGALDLGGGHLILESGGVPYQQSRIFWTELSILRGAGDCR